MPSKYFEKVLEKSSQESKVFVSKTFDIIEQLSEILIRKHYSHKRLSELLGKSESEISKWFSGTNNFTVKTLSRLEAVLGEEIITTPSKLRHDLFRKDFKEISPKSEDKVGSKQYLSKPGISRKSELKIIHNRNWKSGKPTETNRKSLLAS